MSRIFLKFLLIAALVVVSLSAQAAQPFTPERLADAQRANKGILVDVTAPWCPTCKAQRLVIEGLERSNPQLVVLEIDFDTSKELLKKLGVQYQSTLIVYKGNKEVGRSTGVSEAAAVTDLIKKAL
jgi:thioredoxin 1